MRTPYSTTGFERREKIIGGVRSVSYVAGSGPDLVYLHGGGTFHGFEFARDWLGRFRVWLPYHAGFGESADAPGMNTLQHYVQHCGALLDALGVSRAHLIGASLGGRLAAQFAISFPNRVDHLVLVAPAGLVLPEFPQPDFSKITHGDWPSYLVHDPASIRRFWPAVPDLQFSEQRLREGRTTAGLLAEGAANASEFARSLGHITAPSLLLWGTEDRMMPAGNARAWQEAMPNARLQLFKGAGHLLLDECAAARACVLQFMIEAAP